MKRLIRVVALVVLIVFPGVHLAAAQSASVGISVTILPTPLVFQVGPDCAFVVTPKDKTVDCTVAVALEQWTYEPDGWRAMLTVAAVKDPTSGETIPSRHVTLVFAETFSATWGQAVDPIGGPFIPAKAYNGPFNHVHVVASAKPGFGIGHYTAILHFRLQAPASQASGVYVPEWKINIANTYS